MKKYYMASILALVLIAGGGALLLLRAQSPGPGMAMDIGRGGFGARGRFARHMAKYLDLTAAQQAQIKLLVQAQRPAIQPAVQQLAAARKDMLAATGKGDFDRAKVSAIAARESQALAQLAVARQELRAKIYNTVLTSGQKAKADQMRRKQADRIERWLQPDGSNPPQ